MFELYVISQNQVLQPHSFNYHENLYKSLEIYVFSLIFLASHSVLASF